MTRGRGTRRLSKGDYVDGREVVFEFMEELR